ncbi:hypothetical protein CICLE_v10010548mg [Citrus x clementina]|uniref:Stigma-specific protein Stig1 n=1 Tax=Citrus clementina TaxID=85681 RepID=V4UN56_CITCL|nr:hypothetical protein CICLE_v10010548mg [Citrus x clementina]
MIRLANALIATILQLSLVVIVEATSTHKVVQQNAIGNASTSTSSPWLNKVANGGRRPRPSECWNRQWICRQGEAPGTRMRCCRNRCVDVFSDVNNCGLCGIRCRFSWQCCRGFCTNTNRGPFNCGRCGNRCPWGVRCIYGMCGYAQPWPRPRPRPRPQPPHPSQPKPPSPCPPRGDQPPKPPRPWPPRGDQPPPMG